MLVAPGTPLTCLLGSSASPPGVPRVPRRQPPGVQGICHAGIHGSLKGKGWGWEAGPAREGGRGRREGWEQPCVFPQRWTEPSWPKAKQIKEAREGEREREEEAMRKR